MTWEALVAEFRSLGGIVRNVSLRRGPRGRGLFPTDPTRPVRLKVPPNLLVPSKDVEIQDNHLVLKASATLGQRERAFFARYQSELVRDADVFDELRQEHLEWNQLPQQVQNALREASVVGVTGFCFSTLSEGVCLKRYLSTRQSDYLGNAVLMPFVELVNCSGQATEGYVHDDGIAISGKFEEEILVNYNHTMDCWDKAIGYGFCDTTVVAHSLTFRYQSAEGERIQIYKNFGQEERLNGIILPVVRLAEDGTVEFPHLLLGSRRQPLLPRAIFRYVTKNTPIKRPDEIFDLIQHYNRLQLLKFLRLSEGLGTRLAAVLRSAAYEQLTTLSNHWGSVSLGAE